MTIQQFLNKTYSVNKNCPQHQNVRPIIICNDGFRMSVQAGYGIYSSPIFNGALHYTSVEIGFPSNGDRLIAEYAECPQDLTETIYPYVPSEIVDELIEKHGGINKIKTFMEYTNENL